MIKVFKGSEDSIHDYELEVIINPRHVLYISVDLGEKSWQTCAGINVAATGVIPLEDVALFQEAIGFADSLLNKRIILR